MSRVSPRRTMHFSLIKVSESLTLVIGVEDTVFDQFVQSELQRVFHDTENVVAAIKFVDASPFEIPQLVAKCVFRFFTIVRATKLGNLTPVRAESCTNQRPIAVESHLSDRPLGKASCPSVGTHGEFSEK